MYAVSYNQLHDGQVILAKIKDNSAVSQDACMQYWTLQGWRFQINSISLYKMFRYYK